MKWVRLVRGPLGDNGEEKVEEGEYVGGGSEKTMVFEPKDLVDIFAEKVVLGEAEFPVNYQNGKSVLCTCSRVLFHLANFCASQVSVLQVDFGRTWTFLGTWPYGNESCIDGSLVNLLIILRSTRPHRAHKAKAGINSKPMSGFLASNPTIMKTFTLRNWIGHIHCTNNVKQQRRRSLERSKDSR